MLRVIGLVVGFWCVIWGLMLDYTPMSWFGAVLFAVTALLIALTGGRLESDDES